MIVSIPFALILKMRTPIPFLALLALSSASCLAADLTGNWLVKQVSDDGNVRETYYDLKQEGSNVTGSMRSASFDRKIESGTVDADGTFTLTLASAGPRPPMKVEGKLVGDELHVMMRGAPQPARHGSNRDPRRSAARARPPAKIPPPALHKVPYNGLAKTPPMGWNSWNKFAGRVTAEDVRGMADAMVSSGMKEAGYVYVNIDDTWEGERDANGNITTNKKFPDMKALADYVHSKGLKLGIYSSPGPEDLRRLRRQLRPRRAGREDLRRLGHRLPEVRLVQRRAASTRTTRCRPSIRRWATRCTPPAARSSTASASTAAPTSGSGDPRSAAICGAPPAISATPGNRWRRSASTRTISRRGPRPATGTIPTCSRSATAA